jgi:hypothetical protein
VRHDHDLLLDVVEMCELLLTHASDRERLANDPVVQAAAQRWIEMHRVVIEDKPVLRRRLDAILPSLEE